MSDLLTNVSPCDCGSRTRAVVGHGVRVPGLDDVRCVGCGALSSMRPADVEALRVGGCQPVGDGPVLSASLDRLAALAEPLRPEDVACPACGAAPGAPCVYVQGARRREGVHPARRPAPGPRGRPASVAYRTTIELDADELARVDARRGERSRTGYLRSLIPPQE